MFELRWPFRRSLDERESGAHTGSRPAAEDASAVDADGQQRGSQRSDVTFLSRTVDELRDFGCFAAETGCGLEPYRSRLSEVAGARRAVLDSAVTRLRERLDPEIQLQRAIQVDALRGVAPEPQFETIAALQAALAERERAIDDLLEEGRNPSLSTRLAAQKRAVLDELSLQRDRIEGRLHAVQPLLRMQQDGWDENAAAFEKRAKFFEERGESCRGRLKELMPRLEELHRSGVSRHIAGLLIWASTIALAGTSFAVARVVKIALQGGESEKHEFLLLKWLAEVQTPWDLLRLMGMVCLVLLVATGAVALVTQLIRFWLQRTDRAWDKSWAQGQARRRPKGNGQRKGSDGDSDPAGLFAWLGIFGGPRGTANEVTDHSLKQLLASLPLVFAGALLAFLLVSFGERKGGDEAWVAAQLGSGFAFLSIVAATLFVTGLVYGQRCETTAPRLRAVLFFTLAVVPLLSLAVAGLWPHIEKRAALSCIAISMMLGATGLAYGLIFRGQFALEEYLERELSRCEVQAAYFRHRPTLASVYHGSRFDDEGVVREVQQQIARQVRASQAHHQRFVHRVRHLLGWLRVIQNTSVEMDAAGGSEQPTLAGRYLLPLDKQDELRTLRREEATLAKRVHQYREARVGERSAGEQIEQAEGTRAEQRGQLQQEHEQALLELENAFAVAKATLRDTYADVALNGNGGAGGHDAANGGAARRGEMQ